MCATKDMATSFELNKSPPMSVVIALFIGKCNNLGSEDQQDWGAAAIAMRRMTDRAYADEEGAPREVDVSFFLGPFFSQAIFSLTIFFSGHFFSLTNFFSMTIVIPEPLFSGPVFFSTMFLRPFFLWPGERLSERSVKRGAQADGLPDRIQRVHAHVDAVGPVSRS